MRTSVCLVLLLSMGLFTAACGDSSTCGANDTPTAAYKRLFDAVKAKDTQRIKGEMSLKSQEFAESLAMRQKNPVEKVYENGFTGTTFSTTLPEIRDERTLDCWGGVEVRNEKENRWEDLPFVYENGAWKFAIGELFSGEFKSPGKNQDTKDKEAANAMRPAQVPVNMMSNTSSMNANVNVNKAPKYDGPQVEPLPKKK